VWWLWNYFGSSERSQTTDLYCKLPSGRICSPDVTIFSVDFSHRLHPEIKLIDNGRETKVGLPLANCIDVHIQSCILGSDTRARNVCRPPVDIKVDGAESRIRSLQNTGVFLRILLWLCLLIALGSKKCMHSHWQAPDARHVYYSMLDQYQAIACNICSLFIFWFE
jgi:hypothetical protein